MKSLKMLAVVASFGFLLNNAEAQSFVTNGLVAYYPFNGNANDASGNGNNGIASNIQSAANRFGQASAAYKFNGIQSAGGSQVVVMNNLLNLGQSEYTINFWFESDTNTQAACLFATYNSDTGLGIDFTPQTSLGSVCYFIGNGTGTWNLAGRYGLATNQYQLNKWYCATLSKSNVVYSFYINGQLCDKATNASALSYNWNDGIRIGAYQPGSQVFKGSIDDVRIYNRALSTNEVAQLFALESAPIVNLRKAVYLDSSNLWTGTNYVVQASTDLINWTNQGSVFTATNSIWHSTNYWDVANWNELFFRLQQQ
ncbi:MAG: LamG domain-containing protein [Verrucomicrobiota bacterium]